MQTDLQSNRLSGAHLRLFVAILMQNETVFQHFKGKLTVNSFSEESYQLLYRVLIDFSATDNSLPSFAEVWADLETWFEAEPDIISEDGRVELEDFLEYAADPDLFHDYPVQHQKMERFAFKAGKRLLLQLHVQQFQQKLQKGVTFEQLPFVLQQTQVQLEMLSMAGHTTQAALTFEPKWDKRNPKFIRTTGLGFLDKYLGGGAVGGEVYGLMAPYGTCKTTLAVMLWCTAAQQSYEAALADDWDGRKGLSIFVSYEASLSPELQHRALMYSARVSRYSLDRMGLEGMDGLMADVEKPLPYEKIKFARQISDGVFEPERVRVNKVIPWLNEYSLCLDFSGADVTFPSAGNGGILEIIQRIKLELRNRGPEYYVRGIVLDYLGLMVDRDSTLKAGPKQKDDHKTYQEAGQRVVTEICKPFQCHTWVFHQLSGAANAMLSPTKTLHHTDAKGSKSFAENLDFALVIGNLNNDAMGQLACTKHRRFKRIPPTVIQVDGEFNSVSSPDNYHIDGKGNIVDKSIMAAVGVAASNDGYSDITASADSATLSGEVTALGSADEL